MASPGDFKNFQQRVDIFYRFKNVYSKRVHAYLFKKVVRGLLEEIKKRKLPKQTIKKILPTKDYELYFDYLEVGAPLKGFLKKINRYFTLEKIFFDKSHSSMELRRDLVLRPRK